MTEPLTPFECDLTDFPFMPLDVARHKRSSQLRQFFRIFGPCAPERTSLPMDVTPSEWRSLRQQVFERDKFTCVYCQAKPEGRDLQADHVLPRSRGGLSTTENLVCACRLCNCAKSDKLVSEWRPQQ